MIFGFDLAKLGLSLSLIIALMATGCGTNGQKSSLSCKKSKPATSEYQDFYQLVAAGIDSCSDMIYFSGECASAPYGVWGSASAGVLGNAVASCNAAMSARNQILGCQLP